MATHLSVIPNPFAHLDHEGQPAGVFPYDPAHGNGAMGWVGARVDRSLAADGQPRTRPLPRPNDLQTSITVLEHGRPVQRRVDVDRAPDKRILFAYALDASTPIPDCPHYRLGFREFAFFPADAATAKRVGVPFVPPAEALQRAAKAAIASWVQHYGEPPNVDAWPAYLRAAAGIKEAPPAADDKPAPLTAPQGAPMPNAAPTAGGDAQ